MLTVEPYRPEMEHQWNEFIARSKNGTFLFNRAYMDYHSDRFSDCSLIFFNDRRLVAVMPANKNRNVITSHAGLTFGGVICDRDMKTGTLLDIFDVLLKYLLESNYSTLIYKVIPHIYHEVPADEDLYALFLHRATLIRRD